jgi:hypothetical protein
MRLVFPFPLFFLSVFFRFSFFSFLFFFRQFRCNGGVVVLCRACHWRKSAVCSSKSAVCSSTPASQVAQPFELLTCHAVLMAALMTSQAVDVSFMLHVPIGGWTDCSYHGSRGNTTTMAGNYTECMHACAAAGATVCASWQFVDASHQCPEFCTVFRAFAKLVFATTGARRVI